jgi:hypothetical protein
LPRRFRIIMLFCFPFTDLTDFVNDFVLHGKKKNMHIGLGIADAMAVFQKA